MGIPLLEGRDLSADDKLGAPPQGRDQRGAVSPSVAGRVTGRKASGVVGWHALVYGRGSRGQRPAGRSGHRSCASGLRFLRAGVLGCGRCTSWLARRSDSSPLAEMRSAVRSIDPFVPITAESSMAEVRRRSLATPRFHVLFFSWFTILALTLSSVGLYGVTVHQIARRRAEYGVRMTLGASVSDVIRGVLGTCLRQIVLGVLGGGLAALFVTRWLHGSPARRLSAGPAGSGDVDRVPGARDLGRGARGGQSGCVRRSDGRPAALRLISASSESAEARANESGRFARSPSVRIPLSRVAYSVASPVSAS